MSRSKLSILLLAVLLPVVPFSVPRIHALGGPLLTAVKGTNGVTVDGIFGSTEWSDAQHTKFTWGYRNGTFANNGDLWLKNNGTNLEFAITVNGTATVNNANDYYENHITLLFDHNNNGIIDNYDSLKSYMLEYIQGGGYAWQYFDSHYNVTTNFYEWDMTTDGAAQMTHNNPGGSGRFTAEFSIPLVSVNGPEDFTLPVNGTIGFELLFQQVHVNGFSFVSDGEGCWPAPPPNCKVPNNTGDLPRPQANGWATIVRSNGGPILDTTPPVIGIPQTQPHSPTSADKVNITASLNDALSGVKNATLYYSTDNWASVNQTVIVNIDQTSHAGTGTIPAQQAGSRVAYYLTAYDYSGNRALNNNGTNYFHYKVGNAPPPPAGLTISDPTLTPSTPGPIDFPTVTVTITDSQASISKVLLYWSPDNWRTTNWENITPNLGSQIARGNITDYPAGTLVYYYLRANDTGGNISIKDNSGNYYSYTVAGQGPPSGPLDWPLLTIPGASVTITSGFLLVLIPAALLLAIVMHSRRRRKMNSKSAAGSGPTSQSPN